MTTSHNPSQIQIYEQLDAYPWNSDQEFQGGLRAILGSVQDSAQIEHLTLRAKCYYFARKVGTPVDFHGYKQWIENGRSSNGATVNGISDAPVVPLDHSIDQGYLPSDPTGTPAVSRSLEGAVENTGGAGGIDTAPRPASFAEICEMIAEGKPIPGIKDIPDTILEGQASESSATKRKKPWENGATGTSAEIESPSWMR